VVDQFLLPSALLLTYFTGSNNLAALALMYIHPEIEVDIEQVIDRFLDKPFKRRLQK
jgi:hypothetical protein